jgi:hypothetical protein
MTKGTNKTKVRKSNAGRPTKMDDRVLSKLREAFLFGCNKLEACAYSEIAPSTLYEYLKLNPEFSNKIEEWQKAPILKAKKTVVDSLDNPKDAQWYLERKRKDEFSTKVENDLRVKELPKPILGGKTVEVIDEIQD